MPKDKQDIDRDVEALLKQAQQKPLRGRCFTESLEPTAKKFIRGCRLAFSRGEYVNFAEAAKILTTHFKTKIGREAVRKHIKTECTCATRSRFGDE